MGGSLVVESAARGRGLIVSGATLAAYIPAALALNLLPGSDMTFCLAQGLRGGPRAGIAAAAGVALGCVIAALVAGAGIGLIVAGGAMLADLIRGAGAVYLLWLAWKSWRGDNGEGALPPALPAATAFRDGMIVNLTNPKVLLFILAFVPQFVDFAAGQVLAQFAIFGVIISAGGMLVNGAVGSFAGGLGRSLLNSPKARLYLARGTALIFAALALRLFVEFLPL